jgi:hypothetical protein
MRLDSGDWLWIMTLSKKIFGQVPKEPLNKS